MTFAWHHPNYYKKLKKKSLVKQFRNDDPSTHLTDENQMKGMLVETLEDAKPKKINKYIEPEMNDFNSITESRLRYEARKTKTKVPEFFEKHNSGLAGILNVSKGKNNG